MITDDLTIYGLGTDLPIDQGWNQVGSRVFEVASGVTVELDNMVIKGANTFLNGGTILNYGTLTLSECSFISNVAFRGGAVYNSSGVLIIDECTFHGNSAEDGGAVYTIGDCDVIGSSFTLNAASVNGGALGAGYQLDAFVWIAGCSFEVNDATGRGGAISNSSEMLIDAETIVEFNRSGMEGGAIYNQCSGDLTIEESFVRYNEVLDDSLVGGGIFTRGTLTIIFSDISDNVPDDIGYGSCP